MRQKKAYRLLARLRQQRIKELRVDMDVMEENYRNEIGSLNALVTQYEGDMARNEEHHNRKVEDLKARLGEPTLKIRALEMELSSARALIRELRSSTGCEYRCKACGAVYDEVP